MRLTPNPSGNGGKIERATKGQRDEKQWKCKKKVASSSSKTNLSVFFFKKNKTFSTDRRKFNDPQSTYMFGKVNTSS